MAGRGTEDQSWDGFKRAAKERVLSLCWRLQYRYVSIFIFSFVSSSCFHSATLSHEKYYNMEAYERRMSALRQGEYLPPANDSYDFEADMKAVTGAHKKKATEQETYMTKEQLMQLRKVQQERNEVSFPISIFMSVKVIIQSPGWQNETARNGCQTKLWSTNGWNHVWWLTFYSLFSPMIFPALVL